MQENKYDEEKLGKELTPLILKIRVSLEKRKRFHLSIIINKKKH